MNNLLNNKKVLYGVGAVLLVMVIAIIIICFVSCGDNKNNEDKSTDNTTSHVLGNEDDTTTDDGVGEKDTTTGQGETETTTLGKTEVETTSGENKETESTTSENTEKETTTKSDDSGDENITVVPDDYKLADKVKDGAILHCWNWSYDSIKIHMQEIAQAGFTAVQTSPVQQPKDYKYEGVTYTSVGTPNGTGGSDGEWWKLYQPVTFNICNNGQSWLGNKQDFAEMCAEGEKYGVKVIVDIVANHMGNIRGWQNSMSDITPQVGEFWNKNMLADTSFWHINEHQCWMSDGRLHVTQGTIGMPDLNTADKRVQEMVLNLLKECVDCGADGFRFDAAKHIETPNDSSAFASDFWPTVINGIRSYADHELFIYGEILNMAGEGFSISNYTQYMSVTDNATGDNKRNDIRYKNAGSAANSGYSYPADKAIVWAESHDTYMGAGSSYLATDNMIKQTWAVVASRKDATPLYFARTYYSDQILYENGEKKNTNNLVQTLMGNVGTMTWSDPSVAAVNNFKNAFIGQSESVSSKDSIVYVERGNSGIVIVNLNGAGNVNIPVKSMKSGTYTDRVSGNTFTVSGGYIKGTITSEDGIAVVYNTETVPYADVSVQGGTLTEESVTVKISLNNATTGTYRIDNGKEVAFNNSTDVVIGSGIEFGQSTTLTITATDGKKTYIYKHVYNKNRNERDSVSYDETSGKYVIYMKNTAGWEDVYCYMWVDGKTNNAGWPGLRMTKLEDGTYIYATDDEYPNVIFNNGTGTQTADLKWPGNGYIYDNSTGQWCKK